MGEFSFVTILQEKSGAIEFGIEGLNDEKFSGHSS